MNNLRAETRMPIIVVYRKLMVLYCVVLILGHIVKYTPPYYIILLISILTVFFSSRNINSEYIKQYLFILIFSLYGIIVATVTEGGYGGPITIITGLMVVYATKKMQFSKSDITILFCSFFVMALYWILKSPTYYSEFFYNQWKGDNSYANANSVGYYLQYAGCFMFIMMSLSNKKRIKFLKWIVVLICSWGCYNLRARMALAGMLFFLVFNIIISMNYKHRRGIIKILLYSSILLEILFPVAYLMLYRSGIGAKIVFFGLAEKGLYSGRQLIWQRAFDAMNTIPRMLFGIGSNQDFWKEGLLNMHNNAMNLYVVVGAVGLIVYFIYLIRYIQKKFDFENCSWLQVQCLLFFICVIVEGMTDVTLFYNNFIAYHFIPLGIALNEKYNKLGKSMYV